MNKKIVHDAVVLAILSLGLGLILGAVYQITKPAIDKADQEAEQKAFFAVFKDAHEFEKVEFDELDARDVLLEGGYKDTIDDVQAAKDSSGNTLGYVITVTAKDGSQGAITLVVGIQIDGTVNGYSILAHSETPGLGAKATEKEFMKQFESKAVEEFIVVKNTPAEDCEIESITGSTITSKAVANACNVAIAFAKVLVGGAQ